ncbi:uncharacterized protein LOC141630343 [Silene latifolia]|uniref:uncharacterized protein LOC141630343 n=1 Tax=Silene latifolia TaxID=37657 RepID=UPI003D786102
MVQDMVEQVRIIRQKMKAAQDRQKSYANLHRRDIEFAMGDKVLLKVSPMRGVMRFGKKGKLSQKFIGPCEILDSVENIELDKSLSYAEDPKEILDRKLHKTRNGETVLLKVLWSYHNVEEATWEPEDAMREHFPTIFDQGGLMVGGSDGGGIGGGYGSNVGGYERYAAISGESCLYQSTIVPVFS